jgi:hypothetical protein
LKKKKEKELEQEGKKRKKWNWRWEGGGLGGWLYLNGQRKKSLLEGHGKEDSTVTSASESVDSSLTVTSRTITESGGPPASLSIKSTSLNRVSPTHSITQHRSSITFDFTDLTKLVSKWN